jgi:deoxyhypusine monooxygenase
MADIETVRRDPATIAALEALLLDRARPLHQRFRALFTLKNLNGLLAVQAIGKGFGDPSALLRHELAYVLGQMQDPHAVPVLSAVLANTDEEPMVRHEAAEALGAIGLPESVALLEQFRTDASPVVAETCEIALDRIRERANPRTPAGTDGDPNPYGSVDPAPPSAPAPVPELRAQLLDTSRSLYDRYRAMFALRNRGDEEAVLALTAGLDDRSALFRHEIAFVLGQLAHPASVPALRATLAKADEYGMVRHECAEALGSIATADVLPLLRQYRQDGEPVVRESCEVALDMYAWETTNTFQYADGLAQIAATGAAPAPASATTS